MAPFIFISIQYFLTWVNRHLTRLYDNMAHPTLFCWSYLNISHRLIAIWKTFNFEYIKIDNWRELLLSGLNKFGIIRGAHEWFFVFVLSHFKTLLLVYFSPKSPVFLSILKNLNFSIFIRFGDFLRKRFCAESFIGHSFQYFSKRARKTYLWAHHLAKIFLISLFLSFGRCLSKDLCKKHLSAKIEKVTKFWFLQIKYLKMIW